MPSPRITPSSLKGKGKAKAEVEDVSVVEAVRPKGKGRASRGHADEASASPASRRKSSVHSPNVEMPPPPVPHKKGKGRRATIGVIDIELEETDETTDDPGGQVKGKVKKRGRPSLPNPPTKKLRHHHTDEIDTPSSPAIETPVDKENPAEPSSSAPLVAATLPSLAHLSFPPPPIRPRERVYGPKTMWYTDPTQLPPTTLKYNGDLPTMLESYIHIDDTGQTPDIPALELRAASDAYFRNRTNYLQHQGRLLRLLDEAEAEHNASLPASSKNKIPTLPGRKTDHQDSMMSHMVQVRNAIMGEAKMKPVVCKKVARMIMAYWEYVEGKVERDRLAEEREMKRKAKDLVRAVRKRWALAVKVRHSMWSDVGKG